MKLIGTFSATDLRGCYTNTLKSLLGISATSIWLEGCLWLSAFASNETIARQKSTKDHFRSTFFFFQ